MSSSNTYKVINWSEYNKSLCNRGSLTIWFDDRLLREWEALSGQKKVVGEKEYSDPIIDLCLTIGMVYGLKLRQTTGFIKSIFYLLGKPDMKVPDYTTLCRRKGGLTIQVSRKSFKGPIHLAVDSTGLKVSGDGEWKYKKHGGSKRRTWRKLHLGVDPETNEILSVELTTNAVDDSEMMASILEGCKTEVDLVTGDGGYDKVKSRKAIESKGAKAVIPPQKNAVMHLGNEAALLKRNLDLCRVREVGRKAWKEESGYHERSLSEVAMFRYKTINGRKLSARKIENQITEVKIGCRILNVFSECGMPMSEKIA